MASQKLYSEPVSRERCQYYSDQAWTSLEDMFGSYQSQGSDSDCLSPIPSPTYSTESDCFSSDSFTSVENLYRANEVTYTTLVPLTRGVFDECAVQGGDQVSVQLGPYRYDYDVNCDFQPIGSNLNHDVKKNRQCRRQRRDSIEDTETQSMENAHPPISRGVVHSTTCRGKGKPPRAEKLWEFILRLLLDKRFNPSYIEWVDRSKGLFRLVQSKALAALWGNRKNNFDMTYEKLSRAMSNNATGKNHFSQDKKVTERITYRRVTRYYYGRDILKPVYGKKLVYKFGPKATGWQIDEHVRQID